MSSGARKRGEAQRKIAEMRQQQARRRRLRLLIGSAVVVVAAAVIAVAVTLSGHKPSAAAQGAATGRTVDGIRCQTTEQAVFHIHQHLAIYLNGTRRALPAGIGIPPPRQVSNGFVEGGKCLYWLHTHDASGIIHVESPVQRTFTLGQFFDIWGQPLTSSQVWSASGKVTAYVNGKQYAGDPRSIPLTSHEVIQLDVGKTVPPQPFTFPSGY